MHYISGTLPPNRRIYIPCPWREGWEEGVYIPFLSVAKREFSTMKMGCRTRMQVLQTVTSSIKKKVAKYYQLKPLSVASCER